MRKLFTVALLLVAGIATAHSFGNISDRKGSLHLPVDKTMATNINREAVSNMKPQVAAMKIAGKPGAAVYAVYAGKVSSVFKVEGREIVILQHDNYFTLYDGVGKVQVKKDDVVTEGQAIGTVNGNDNSLTFQIWMSENGSPTSLLPTEWIEK